MSKLDTLFAPQLHTLGLTIVSVAGISPDGHWIGGEANSTLRSLLNGNNQVTDCPSGLLHPLTAEWPTPGVRRAAALCLESGENRTLCGRGSWVSSRPMSDNCLQSILQQRGRSPSGPEPALVRRKTSRRPRAS